MIKMNRKLSLFFIGILAAAVGLPAVYAVGVPSFSTILTAVLGAGSIWAYGVTVLLLGTVLFGVHKVIKAYN
ncbi:hypothetical protein [Sporosarcina sp. NCCP-2716]|uniref:hypothetical protein n=1 Tax=Sporosarcina sp. NCCP-2716 TaxID=2943679 RepID=UPI00203D35FC|nr:hypothetical protein [Sporosarcina sp. NCCP-2716]